MYQVVQDFDSETSKLGMPLVDSASARLLLRLNRLSREIFTEDDPVGFGAANSIVASDELEFGRRLVLCGVKRAPSWTEGDSVRRELTNSEVVPNEMRQRLRI